MKDDALPLLPTTPVRDGSPDDDADVRLIGRISAVPTILRILCDTTGLGFGAVARVTDTSWTACAVLDRIGFGLKAGGQLDVATTLCHRVHASLVPIVIDEASVDTVHGAHPAPRLYGFESYISVPIVRTDGSFFGTICALDTMPVPLSRTPILPTLRLFSELIAAQIEIEEHLETSRQALLDASEVGVLRDQFLAVLGHDLRNPLAAIVGGLDWLSGRPLDGKAAMMVGNLRNSARRMAELVENILDFSRGRLGGGMPVRQRDVAGAELAATLLQVVDELRGTHPHHVIRPGIDLRVPVFCDPQRIGQLLSNLLANALTHGARDTPVDVAASSSERDRLLLTVGNRGEPIPADRMIRLFQPFNRTAALPGQAGLGLGLYIASEVARSHGGTLGVSSTVDDTTFTLRLPAGTAAALLEPPRSA